VSAFDFSECSISASELTFSRGRAVGSIFFVKVEIRSGYANKMRPNLPLSPNAAYFLAMKTLNHSIIPFFRGKSTNSHAGVLFFIQLVYLAVVTANRLDSGCPSEEKSRPIPQNRLPFFFRSIKQTLPNHQQRN
jgi:hypothetical protein